MEKQKSQKKTNTGYELKHILRGMTKEVLPNIIHVVGASVSLCATFAGSFGVAVCIINNLPTGNGYAHDPKVIKSTYEFTLTAISIAVGSGALSHLSRKIYNKYLRSENQPEMRAIDEGL